jgi:hypothetical protein
MKKVVIHITPYEELKDIIAMPGHRGCSRPMIS